MCTNGANHHAAMLMLAAGYTMAKPISWTRAAALQVLRLMAFWLHPCCPQQQCECVRQTLRRLLVRTHSLARTCCIVCATPVCRGFGWVGLLVRFAVSVCWQWRRRRWSHGDAYTKHTQKNTLWSLTVPSGRLVSSRGHVFVHTQEIAVVMTEDDFYNADKLLSYLRVRLRFAYVPALCLSCHAGYVYLINQVVIIRSYS